MKKVTNKAIEKQISELTHTTEYLIKDFKNEAIVTLGQRAFRAGAKWMRDKITNSK